MSTQFGDTRRTLGTGDLVISVSEIFDRLQGQVNPNVLDQLLRDIISGRRDRVRPGELITAELINQILAELESLETRVTALEGGSTNPTTPRVEITGFSGPSPLRVGDPLVMNGRNFQQPTSLNEVTMGGVRIQRFGLDSSDTRLTFDVPNISGLSPEGSPVPVVITNANGTDSDQIVVRPARIVPQGRLEVIYSVPPVMPDAEPNITSSRTYDFTFNINPIVTMPGNQEVTYTVTPTITGAAGWTAALEGSNQITIAPGSRRDVRVRVTLPINQAAGTAGTLRVAVAENTSGTLVTPGNAQIEMRVGSPPPTPELRVRITVRSGTNAATLTGTGAQFNRTINNGTGSIQFSILLTEAGAYTVEARMADTTGWTFRALDVTTFNVPAVQPGTTVSQVVTAAFTAGQSAIATDMLITVRRGTDLSIQYALPITVI